MKSKDHTFNLTILTWRYCSKCGLIAMKNERSRRKIKKQCQGTQEDN